MSANFYSVTGMARLLGLSAKTLRKWDRSGKYPAGRHSGGDRVYTDQDLQPLKVLADAIPVNKRRKDYREEEE